MNDFKWNMYEFHLKQRLKGENDKRGRIVVLILYFNVIIPVKATLLGKYL